MTIVKVALPVVRSAREEPRAAAAQELGRLAQALLIAGGGNGGGGGRRLRVLGIR